MTILAFDTSTQVCSAALLHDGTIVAQRQNTTGSNHAALLPLYVQELQAIAREQGKKIEAVAIGNGPGSYTGLRISASLAKGLCYGLDIPLYAVPTLSIIAGEAVRNQKSEIRNQKSALFCPMIDARRMEVYTAVYDAALQEVRPLEAKIIDEQSFADLLEEHVMYFCGDGAAKCKDVIKHPNARWIDNIVPTGAMAGLLAEGEVKGERKKVKGEALCKVVQGKDIAYYEPNYLKDFIAAPSHVKGLK